MKINLFFFISNFNFGGAGNAIFTFLKNLDSKKFDIHIICLGESQYKKILPKNVKLHSLNKHFLFFRTFFNFFIIRNLLKKLIEENKKNVFISNIHFANVLTIIFLRNLKYLKIILFERTSLKELDIFVNFKSFIKNKIVKLLIKATYKKSDKILSNSKSSQKEFNKINVKSSIIYSGCLDKVEKFKKKNKKILQYNFISVGRLTYQKNYYVLFKAIKLLKNKNFNLKIFGDGELKSKIKNYLIENSLTKKITLMGHHKNKKKIYSKADLLIHCSLFEGLPNVIVEAMNFSVPIIAENSTRGTREVLKSGQFGDLFQSNNAKELSKKIDLFMLNPKRLQKKVSSSRLFLNKFTKKNSTKKLEKILIDI